MKNSNWSFPDIFDFSFLNDTTENLSPEELLSNKLRDVESQLAALQIQKEFLEAQTLELAETKSTYENKLKNLSTILPNFENPLHILDVQMFEFINTLIKKICKRLILKELEVSPEIFSVMVASLHAALPNAKDILEIQVSSEGLAALKYSDTVFSKMLVENSQLQAGDIVVKTQFGEVNALLDERLNYLLGKM